MRFCGNCGSALAPAPPTIEERKLVTILFADAVASTTLAGAVDPERLRAQMGRFFAIAREEIERYGGTVEKFIGDAVMAVFGLPAVHEDDPERAARAAVAIRERVAPLADAGSLPRIRIGLYTGEVVADPNAAEKGEFLVTGESVNLAARVQQGAEPGQILLGERTSRALSEVAEARALPPMSVKGRTDPLGVWELLRIAPPRERALRATPFVGRLEELNLLAGHVRKMLREGRGHVVTILGSAGVGKTRLIQEFRERTGEVHILRGRALPYGAGVPFWSLGEAIREEAGILFGDSLDVARGKLEKAAADLEITSAVPALLPVLGLGGEGRELTREELFTGMRAFFQAVAGRAPLLLALEDFHSAEDVTLDFVEQAADWTRDVAMMLLVLSRPELVERRRVWMGGKRSATTLFLDPLAGEESLELAVGILGGRTAPQPLLDLVLARAEGNPLFMEEMLRVLIEQNTLRPENGRWALTVPLGEVAIPDTVQAVIGARVDALPPAEKQTLQGAAVQGKDFWLGPLRLITDADDVEDAVAALVEKELLVRKPRSTLLGEEELTFRHILIRDVAYAMIPKARRLPLHARLAEWTTQMAADRPAEWADYIAHHWLQVVVLRRELGLPPEPHARDRAIANLLVGGDRAATVYANTTALDHYSRALDLEPERPARLQALLGRGEVWMFLGQYEQARDDFETIRRVAQEDKDARWEALALDRIGHSYRMQDQIPRALECFEAALALSRGLGDGALTGRILTHIGFAHFSDGRHTESIAAHQQARPLLEADADAAGLAGSLHGVAENLVFLGRFPAALEHLSEAATAAEAVGNRSLAMENTYMAALIHIRQGAYPAAQGVVERAVAVLTEIGDVWNLSAALYVAAEQSVATGEFGKALEQATRGLNLARQVGASRLKVYNLRSLGMIHRALEDYNGAWPFDHEAADLSRQTGGSWRPAVLSGLALDAAALGRLDEARALLSDARREIAQQETRVDFLQELAHAAGRLHLAAGAPAAALAEARELHRLAEEAGTEHWRAPGFLLEADALMAEGDPQTALRRYQDAVQESERLGRLPLLWRALAGAAESQHALGRSADAAAAASRARDLVDRLAASVPDERLRAVFLQSGRVQRLASLAGA
jgi:class 3 adenylate cyclase/tetratricopeptide (TPR) repeat protein